MPQIRPNNPAARMYIIINRMWELDYAGDLEQAWELALGHEGSRSKLLIRIGMVYGLPGKIQKQLQRDLDYDDSDMIWWEDLSQSFMVRGLNEPWDAVKNSIPLSALRELKQRATALNRNMPEPYLDDSVLDDLKKYVAQIREAMQEEEQLEPDLKDFLRQRINIINELLDDIEIVGIADTEAALKQATAEIKYETQKEETPLKPETKRTFRGFTSKIAAVLMTYHLFLNEIEHTTNVATTITAAVVKTVENTGKLVQLAIPDPHDTQNKGDSENDVGDSIEPKPTIQEDE